VLRQPIGTNYQKQLWSSAAVRRSSRKIWIILRSSCFRAMFLLAMIRLMKSLQKRLRLLSSRTFMLIRRSADIKVFLLFSIFDQRSKQELTGWIVHVDLFHVLIPHGLVVHQDRSLQSRANLFGQGEFSGGKILWIGPWIRCFGIVTGPHELFSPVVDEGSLHGNGRSDTSVVKAVAKGTRQLLNLR